ncbi:MAG TPA: TPM domain-containing protein [Pseudomonadales bacterium]|nr:TPM domain-containing protein [Pseudomonadales bacterium]
MGWQRITRHLLTTPLHVRRAFTAGVGQAIEQAITASELHHRGEVRFVVEGSMDILPLLRGVSARQRAVQLFSQLGVWDTEQNTGVLVYVLFAERRLEIVADRGIAACVAQTEWDAISAEMSQAFRSGQFQSGAVAGLQRITALLAAHFPPAAGGNPDELPNRVLIL